MNQLVTEIISYLDYLNNTCRLNTSIHFVNEKLSCIPECELAMLLMYNRHKNPYCIKVKSNEENKKRCHLSQSLVLKKCSDCGSFCGVCYAGVREYIYPILEDGLVVGYATVSGYRLQEPPKRNINLELWESSLSLEEIPMELCSALIPPLCRMLELLFTYPISDIDSEYNLMLQFINEYHNQITLSELCRQFGRSRSYISHMFKSKSGMNLKTYCNNLKLEDAKNLLSKTEIPITEIAFDVGFNDVSYFIQLFKNKFSITPLKYRKMHRH